MFKASDDVLASPPQPGPLFTRFALAACLAAGCSSSSGTQGPSAAGAFANSGVSNGGAVSSGGAGTSVAGASALPVAGASSGSESVAGGADAAGAGGSAPIGSGGAEASGGSTSMSYGGAVGISGAFPSVGSAGGTSDFSAPGQLKITYHGKFMQLPIGAVKGQGWLKGWLQRQDNGMTGHPENMGYPFNTGMYAVGKIPDPTVRHGDPWWRYEQSGYYVDAVARLSGVSDAPNALTISTGNATYISAHAGPAKLGESTWSWPNTTVGRSLMAGYDATGDVARVRALSTCVKGSTSTSGRDGDIAEEALYVYGLSGDADVLAFAKKVYNAYFMSGSTFASSDKINGSGNLIEHGVTAAEQLKLLPLMYSYTGDTTALSLAEKAYSKIESNSLMPDGGMVSQEKLATTAFNSLHESCDLSDWSWSIGYLFMADGTAHWGDLIEQTLYNAVPGAVSKDFKQLQYFSSANQIVANDTVCPVIAKTRMSYRAGHDTECCSGNINRAMPNFVSRLWMGMPGGLAATMYGPSEVKVNLNQQPVTISEVTDYPFRDTITLNVATSRPVTFTLGMRIPGWCTGATVTVNGTAAAVTTTAGTFATLTREFRDGDSVVIHLPMTVQLKPWLGGSAVSVQRGPLVYSLKIDETRAESTTDSASIKPVLLGNNIAGFPALTFTPASEWRYGIAAAERNSPQSFTVTESATMPDNPFDGTTLPVKIQVPMHSLLQWQASWNASTASVNPTALPTSQEKQSVGAAQLMTLVPYGSTYLRLTMLPALP